MAIECTVKFSAGAYVTSAIQGKRASCTHSEDEAVRRLGRRLLGDRLDHVERVADCEDGTSRWRIVEVPHD